MLANLLRVNTPLSLPPATAFALLAPLLGFAGMSGMAQGAAFPYNNPSHVQECSSTGRELVRDQERMQCQHIAQCKETRPADLSALQCSTEVAGPIVEGKWLICS